VSDSGSDSTTCRRLRFSGKGGSFTLLSDVVDRGDTAVTVGNRSHADVKLCGFDAEFLVGAVGLSDEGIATPAEAAAIALR
jgi:hypothetical protein